MNIDETELIVQHVAQGYEWKDIELSRVHAGQSTMNYSGRADGRPIFVKVYPPGADINAERASIELSEYAGRAGVPTARVMPTIKDSMVLIAGDTALSVWEFVEGESVDRTHLDRARMSVVGTAIGNLHRVFAAHPASPVHLEYGELCDLDRTIRKIDKVLTTLTSQPDPDEFTEWAIDVLRWRIGLIPRIAALQAELPPLTSQVLHGDLATPNVLFDGDRLSALVDFRPPRARPIAWEISRLACDPRTVVGQEDWRSGLVDFMSAYRAAMPGVPVTDLTAAVRVWVCYSATTIYPYDDLANGEAALPEILRTYAQDRQAAVVAVLDRLDSIERDVQEAVATIGAPH